MNTDPKSIHTSDQGLQLHPEQLTSGTNNPEPAQERYNDYIHYTRCIPERLVQLQVELQLHAIATNEIATDDDIAWERAAQLRKIHDRLKWSILELIEIRTGHDQDWGDD